MASTAPDPSVDPEPSRDLPALNAHLDKHWGPGLMLREKASSYIRLDLRIIPASTGRPHHTIITTGMSNRPIVVGKAGGANFFELVLALPGEWPIEPSKMGGARFWWPLRQLLLTARFPHATGAPFGYGHTLANEQPPAPFHESVQLCGCILSVPLLCPEEAVRAQVGKDKEIKFLSLLPLHLAELEFARTNGSMSLLDRLHEQGVTELLDVTRPSFS